MKQLTAIIERNEDAFFAYLKDLDGCVAGGSSYEEVKSNLEEMINILIEEDAAVKKQLSKGYKIKFEVDLESIFDLIPEVNISQLAKTGKLNPGLLRQYVSGTKRASESQAAKVMMAIREVSKKLNSIVLTTD